MIIQEIREALLAQADEGYKRFHSTLVPTEAEENLIGVRVPVMRKLAKDYAKRENVSTFLCDLPHRYYEENALHSFIVSEIKDFDRCLQETERFLPYITNWAVCDCFSPSIFTKHKPQLFASCKDWLQSEHTYTVRFGLVMLLKHFLTEEYAEEALRLAAAVDSEEYYINMAISWLFAEAVGKCSALAIGYLERQLLKTEVHNKAIQKSVESRRVPSNTKAYLKSLKRKKEL